MDTLRVTPGREQIELSIQLQPFITDWPSAQQKFSAEIPRRIYDLTRIQPRDINMTYGNSLGDASCGCRLFEGSGNIVLNADTLKLSFANVTRDAYKVVFETIRRAREFLASEFPENRVLWFSLHSSQNVAVSDNAAIDTYLKQFAHEGAVEIVQREARIRYRPSIRVTLEGHDQHWQLHRAVEESRSPGNGLFVTTSIYIPETELTAFSGFEEGIAHLHELADRAVGLQRRD